MSTGSSDKVKQTKDLVYRADDYRTQADAFARGVKDVDSARFVHLNIYLECDKFGLENPMHNPNSIMAEPRVRDAAKMAYALMVSAVESAAREAEKKLLETLK